MSPRSRKRFDADWRFFKGEASRAERPDFDDRAFRRVCLPHDFSIEGPFDPEAPGGGSQAFAPAGVGWYRKRFELAPDPRACAWVEFDGAYHRSRVWLNGVELREHHYGYTGFHVELGSYLRAGENLLAVRVDNSNVPNCRWYTGSGIYRHVWLVRAGTLRVPWGGVSVTTPEVSASRAVVIVETDVEDTVAEREFVLETTLLAPDDRAVATERTGGVATDGARVTQRFELSQPALWSLEHTNLYRARSVLLAGAEPSDEVTTRFGVRSARFDPQAGFLLNGEPTKLKGVCLHHDAGAVGAAVPDRVLARRLALLKEIGCNAIRTAHNPPAPELLDLCDDMGFVVVDEAFDKWRGRPEEAWWMKSESFDAHWREDLRFMLRRDRNHPSVVLWSVGNETGEPGSEELDATLGELVEFVHREEPSRPVTCALILPHADSVPGNVERVLQSGRRMDVVGLNYQEPIVSQLHEAAPDLCLLCTESFRYFGNSETLRTGFDPKNPWWDTAERAFVAGQFVWAGFDYLGESQRWPLRGFPCGIFDACGFLKPDGWFQRSVWSAEPVVRIAVYDAARGSGEAASSWGAPHLVEHWNFERYRGELLRLQTQTNCETVELVVNGASHGIRRAADSPNRAVIWYVPFQPGTLEAVGRNGERVVARHSLKTTGPATRIDLHADRVELVADELDIAHVVASLEDAEGLRVPDSDRALHFELSGPGSIAGLDNGDLTCDEPYQGTTRTTRSGRCLAILRAGGKAGTVTLRVAAEGVPTAILRLSVGV